MSNERAPHGLKTYSQVKRSRNLFVFSFLILPFIGFLLFYVYVNLESILMAFQFTETKGDQVIEKWGLDTWSTVFKDLRADGSILKALKNTLLFYLSNQFIVFPVALFMAYFFFKKIAGYKAFRFIFYLPSIVSSSVLVVLFKSSLATGGIIESICSTLDKEYTYILGTMGGESGMMTGLLIYSILFGFGGKLIVLCGSMNGISREVMEAGEIDGCNWFQEFYLLVVPMLWPTLSTMITLEAAGLLGVSGPILAFRGWEQNVSALSFILYDKVANVSGKGANLYYTSALGLLMTAITFPIVLLIRKWTSRGEE